MKKVTIIFNLFLLFSGSFLTLKTSAADIYGLKQIVDDMEIIKNEVINGKSKAEKYLEKYTEYESKIGEINFEFQKIVDEKSKIIKELNENQQQLESTLIYYQESKPGENTIPINQDEEKRLGLNSSTDQVVNSINKTVEENQKKLNEVDQKNQIIKTEGEEIAFYATKVFNQQSELRKVGKLENFQTNFASFESQCKANPTSSETCKNFNQYQKEASNDSATLGGSIINNGFSSVRKDNPAPKVTPEKKASGGSLVSQSIKEQPTSFGVVNKEGSCRPSTGVITQEFGYTAYALTGAYGGGQHTGIDIQAGYGSPIYASFSGTVFETKPFAGAWGNTVIIKHFKDGITFYTRYAHLSSITVANGEEVKACQQVGREGSTGFSEATHLHFGVYVGGINESNAINPRNFVSI